MTLYTPADTFASQINIYDTTDPVLGGSGGESNNPIKALADRTEYLFNRLGRYLDVRVITAPASVNVVDTFKLIKIEATGNLAITLADVNGFENGAVIAFKAKCPASKIITLTTSFSQLIVDGNNSSDKQWLCDGEQFNLVAVVDTVTPTNSYWEFIPLRGNFDKVGEIDYCRKQPRNSLIANGCNPESSGALYLRADHARLWAMVEADAIEDVTWLSSGFNWRGFFSKGDGATTFRVPDLRGMFLRAHDYGRGVDVGRTNPNISGSYEADENKSHNHNLDIDPDDTSQGATGFGKFVMGGEANEPSVPVRYTAASGGLESRPKNIGVIPVIYY